jgi:hypothetical protein
MPSSEDYTVVWAGIYQRLTKEPRRSTQTSILKATLRRARLQFWEDAFEIDPVEGPVSCVLIGRRLGLLGYKEGRVRLTISNRQFDAVMKEIDKRLKRAGLRGRAELHVLVHVEDPEADD